MKEPDGAGGTKGRGEAGGMESRGAGWSTPDQGGARGMREPGGASGLPGHGREEGARSHGEAEGSMGRGRVRASEAEAESRDAGGCSPAELAPYRRWAEGEQRGCQTVRGDPFLARIHSTNTAKSARGRPRTTALCTRWSNLRIE